MSSHYLLLQIKKNKLFLPHSTFKYKKLKKTYHFNYYFILSKLYYYFFQIKIPPIYKIKLTYKTKY